MVIIQEYNPKDFFQERLAVLQLEGNILQLVFEKPFVASPRNKYKESDSISRTIFTTGELNLLKREFKINKFPFEIFSQYVLEDIYKEIRQ
jgi:hypothetical protein